jgi:hypothetical protein
LRGIACGPGQIGPDRRVREVELAIGAQAIAFFGDRGADHARVGAGQRGEDRLGSAPVSTLPTLPITR